VKRRAFLRLGAMAPAMLALGSLPLGGLACAGAAPDEAILDTDEAELMLAVVERMVDTGEPGAPSPREVGALAAIERVLARLDPGTLDSLRTALVLVDWWPAIAELRLRRFRNLSPEERDASLEGWRTSTSALRRSVFYGLRNLAMLGYWSQDATWPLVGYPGPWLARRA
jgi:hypothetical protein